MDKQDIFDNLNYYLFFTDMDKVDMNLSLLVNQMSKTIGFISVTHKGKQYSNIYPNSYVPETHIKDVELKLELVGQLEQLIAEKAEIRLDMSIVSSYMRKALNIAENEKDLMLLLDKSLHKYIATPAWLVQTLTDEQVYNFKSKNDHLFETIKKKLLTNLIMKRG